MTFTSPMWDNLKLQPGRVTERTLALVDRPIIDPPHIDVGEAAIFWKIEEEQ